MPEFFESIEEDGKVLEDSTILKYFTPFTDTSLITQFSGDACVIRKINCSSPYLQDSIQGFMQDNLSDSRNLDLLEVIGKPETQKLQPVRNMIVNNRSIEQDTKISQAIQGKTVEDVEFTEYNISVTNLKINSMYNSKLEDFLFLRKQMDALFVKSRKWFRWLFYLHIIYTILLIIPIFDPHPERRMILSWICFSISCIYAILEWVSIFHSPQDHWQDLYNVVDTLQIFIQLPYSILVTKFKDV